MHLRSLTLILFILTATLNVLSQTSPAAVAPAGVPVKAEDCGCEQRLPEVLATVNGAKLTKLDISHAIESRIKEFYEDVIDARRREVDLQINAVLLDAEAKRQGSSTLSLLDREVTSKVVTPTDAAAEAFFEKNKNQIPGEFKDVKDDVIVYLREERQQEAAKKLADRLRTTAQLQIAPGPATAPTTEQERSRVFATVNGKRITSGDVEDSLRALIFEIQGAVFKLRKHELDLRINDLLLTQEAQKRGVTKASLLDAELTAKQPKITDADAEKLYAQNLGKIKKQYAEVKDQIIQRLREEAAHKAETALVEKLRAGAQVQMFLTEPEPPTYTIAVDDQPMKGNPNATVTIVVFSDFQCPSCSQQHPIIERLIAEYGNRVRFVMRDFPLSQHKQALKAAAAAEAAREQGKFWEYAHLLFHHQSALQVENLKAYASELSLDRAKFDAALESEAIKEQVQRDIVDGERIGVAATPTTFINGKEVLNRSYEGLKSALETSLKGS
ncbi:MAG: thioredoxin domain-containing protein [bacterium]